MGWQSVEEEVRAIAEAVWSSPCRSEQVAGTQCDGVVHVRKDYLVLIEISVRDDLAKLRDDVTKLTQMKAALMSQGKYAETYFVTSQNNHPSLTAAADAAGVEFHTIESFASKFLASSQYVYERSRRPFGSAVEPQTGVSDESPFTPISYVDPKGKKYSVEDISAALAGNKRIILLGEFGTGKSRCVKETFRALSDTSDSFTPIAIDLRDNWGYRRFDHMVRNHLDALGLSDFADNLVKSVRRGNHPLLLDGFDEIGSQSWSGDAAMLAEVRRKSLEGVRDAVQSSGGAGLVITGRDHYFSSDTEMLESLGLEADTIVLRCPEEFSEAEAANYVSTHSKSTSVPEWMPRKPLICQLLVTLDPAELILLQESADGEVDFFERVVDAICHRETRINAAIDASTVKRILLRLAQGSRTQPDYSERLTLQAINEAFFAVTGYAPIDESAILLQRLPYLGRVGAESSDRTFIDPYAKGGLRGLAVEHSFATSAMEAAREIWVQPLDYFGMRVWSRRLVKDASPLKFVRQCIAHGNMQAAADYVATRLLSDDQEIDFEKLSIDGGEMTSLSFIDVSVKNLTITNAHVSELTFDNARFDNVFIDDCLVDRLVGVSSRENLPTAFGTKVFVEEYDEALSSARISTLNLTNSQKTLMALVKKLFFQPGSGRREEALVRGTESYWDKTVADKVLRQFVTEGVLQKVKGDQGWVYIPQRRYTKRMASLIAEQKLSQDPYWELVS